MNTLLQKPFGLMAALVMVLTILILPQAPLARVLISDGTNPGSSGGGEGDPLDSNDYSSGGGDGEVHERRIIPRDSDLVVFDLRASSGVIMLRVDFIGDVPVFSIFIASAAEVRPEASYVR